MSSVLDVLARHGLMLLAGGTMLLAAGGVGAWFQRSPAQRQRLGELTVLSVMLWTALACLPLPRVRLSGWTPASVSAGATGGVETPGEAADRRADGSAVHSGGREGEAPAEPRSTDRGSRLGGSLAPLL